MSFCPINNGNRGLEPWLQKQEVRIDVYADGVTPLVPVEGSTGLLNGRLVTLLNNRLKELKEKASWEALNRSNKCLLETSGAASVCVITVLVVAGFFRMISWAALTASKQYYDQTARETGEERAQVMKTISYVMLITSAGLCFCSIVPFLKLGVSRIRANDKIDKLNNFSSRNTLEGLPSKRSASAVLLTDVLTKLEGPLAEDGCKEIVKAMSCLQLWSVWERLSEKRRDTLLTSHLDEWQRSMLEFLHNPNRECKTVMAALKQLQEQFKKEPELLGYITARLSDVTLQNAEVAAALQKLKIQEEDIAVPFPFVDREVVEDAEGAKRVKKNRTKQFDHLNRFIQTGEFSRTVSDLNMMLVCADVKGSESHRRACRYRILEALDINHGGLWSNPDVAQLLYGVVDFDGLSKKGLEVAKSCFGRILELAKNEHNWPLLSALLDVAKQQLLFKDYFKEFKFDEHTFRKSFPRLKAVELAFDSGAPGLKKQAGDFLTLDTFVSVWEDAHRNGIAIVKEACTNFAAKSENQDGVLRAWLKGQIPREIVESLIKKQPECYLKKDTIASIWEYADRENIPIVKKACRNFAAKPEKKDDVLRAWPIGQMPREIAGSLS